MPHINHCGKGETPVTGGRGDREDCVSINAEFVESLCLGPFPPLRARTSSIFEPYFFFLRGTQMIFDGLECLDAPMTMSTSLTLRLLFLHNRGCKRLLFDRFDAVPATF